MTGSPSPPNPTLLSIRERWTVHGLGMSRPMSASPRTMRRLLVDPISQVFPFVAPTLSHPIRMRKASEKVSIPDARINYASWIDFHISN